MQVQTIFTIIHSAKLVLKLYGSFISIKIGCIFLKEKNADAICGLTVYARHYR